jgi:hypothetical protein
LSGGGVLGKVAISGRRLPRRMVQEDGTFARGRGLHLQPSTMPFPAPPLVPKPGHKPPARLRRAQRVDVLWNKPIFKAPPLTVRPPVPEEPTFEDELPQVVQGFR